MITVNPDRTDILIETLTHVWEASVRATHDFLTEEDILRLASFVKMELSEIETLVVASDNNTIVAFMGIDGSKIEMLFVSSDNFGRGIGKKLVELAIARYKVKYVDVNEQNLQATGFYRHIGFEVFERMESDAQGNPFPILKMKLQLFSVRKVTFGDITALKELFQNTILAINRRDYSQEEVEDWASCGNDLSRWKELMETNYFIVAEDRQSQIVGFSSVTRQGYLHSMFVHKDFQEKGIATLLLKEIEEYAGKNGINKLTSEVSITARPFFEKRGYKVEKKQTRQAKQLLLTNFYMVKEFTTIKS